MKLYVGNFPYETTEESLTQLFAPFGAVQSVKIITNPYNGRSKGFGFVEMDDASADQAIVALDGTDCGGRTLKVAVANPEPAPGSRPPRGDRGDRDRRPRGGMGGGGHRRGPGGGGGGGRGGYRGGDRDRGDRGGNFNR